MRPVELDDKEDGFIVKYEASEDVDGVNFTETVVVRIKVGTHSNDKITIRVIHEEGNRLYFKKVAKEIKASLAYCKA